MGINEITQISTESNHPLKYLIFGTGALGSVFGGFLQLNGYDVSYVGLGSHFETLMKEGLKISGIWGEYFIPSGEIRGYFDYTKIREKFDVILLCVKSTHTEIAVDQAKTLLNETGILISIQNGLGNVEIISGRVGVVGLRRPKRSRALPGPAWCSGRR